MSTRTAPSGGGEGGSWQTPPPYFFNPFHLQSWITFLVLGPAFINYADGCIRRSLFQPQTTTPQPTPSPSPIEETTMGSHKQACFEDEILKINCLHGGTCHVVILSGGQRQSLCHCTSDWTGRRCEQVYINPYILQSMKENMRTANIAAGVSVCILIIFVLLLALFVYLRFRRKQRLLLNQEFEASAEQLYRRPFNKRSSIVESVCRTSSLLKASTATEGPVPHTTSAGTTDDEVHICIETSGNGPPPPPLQPSHSPGEEKRPLPTANVIEAVGPPLPYTNKESAL